MTNILNASAAVVQPYQDSNLKITVSSVVIDAAGVAKIAWSDTKNGTARAVGTTVTLPAALNTASSSLIWAEAQYTYTPTIGYMITGYDESDRPDLHAAAALRYGHAHALMSRRMI